MCYNVEIFLTRDQIAKRFGVVVPAKIDYRPNYYLTAFEFPKLPVIRNDNPGELDLIQWGLIPGWIKDEDGANEIKTKTLNARGETLFEKASFKFPAKNHRCLILLHGFFEWQKENKKNIPHYIFHETEEPFAVAGIFNTWRNPSTNQEHITLSLITTEAKGIMVQIHNTKKRMPAILRKEVEKEWINDALSENDLKDILSNEIDSSLKNYTVSSLISKKGVNKNTSQVLEKQNYNQNLTLF